MTHKLVAYMPLTQPTINKRIVESFIEMTGPLIQDILRKKYHVNLDIWFKTQFPLDFNGCDAIERMLTEKQADYLFFIDCDIVAPRMTLPWLFETISDGAPVVSGQAYMKTQPHHSLVGRYLPWTPQLRLRQHTLSDLGFIDQKGEQCLFYEPIGIPLPEEPFQIDCFGLSCVLFKKEAFSKISQPYLKHINPYQSGDFTLPQLTEDMWLSAQFHKANVKVLCDPRVQCGHLSEQLITFANSQPIPKGPKIVVKERIYAQKD